MLRWACVHVACCMLHVACCIASSRLHAVHCCMSACCTLHVAYVACCIACRAVACCMLRVAFRQCCMLHAGCCYVLRCMQHVARRQHVTCCMLHAHVGIIWPWCYPWEHESHSPVLQARHQPLLLVPVYARRSLLTCRLIPISSSSLHVIPRLALASISEGSIH
jgi:hypothetical protein